MAEEKQSRKSRLAEIRYEFFKTTAQMITAAFALVAALAWNSLVQNAIDRYFGQAEGLKSGLIYALGVTILAVIISVYFGNIAARFKKDIEDGDK